MCFKKNLHLPGFPVLALVCFLLFCNPVSVQAQLIPETQTETEPDAPEIPEDSLGRRTPRGTVQGFVRAVADQDYTRASRFLNLEEIPEDEQDEEELIQDFQRLLDRGGNLLAYSLLSNDPEGYTDDDLPIDLDRIGTVGTGGKEAPLYVEQTEDAAGEPVWLFSTETVERITTITPVETLVDTITPGFINEIVWGGIPLGHWLFMILLIIPAYLLAWCIVWLILFLTRRLWPKARTEPTSGIIQAFALPFRIYLAVWFFEVLSLETGVSFLLRQRISEVVLIIRIVAILILLWKLTDFISSFSERKMSLRGKVSWISIVLFLRRMAKVTIVILGIIAILGAVGVDVTTGLAALGIGGIALALGAQKTIENFVGSVTLVADQPVRVGDFCKVGDTIGTVESIGMRSTRIRTLDRTIITIPNGQFSSEKIENYAHRDRFWFHPVFGLRYESTPDQIRYLLVELRAVLYAHPMVSPDPSRVRFVELGADSINLEVFAYINVSTFDEFLEVKEDLLLQMMDVVGESGTGFAFPSQTIYFGRDTGLSKEKSQQAEERVKQWRKKGEMQLPEFDPERIKSIENKTPYPPEGSVKRKENDIENKKGL